MSPAAQLKCCRDLLKIVLGTNSNLVWEISRELTIKHLSRMLATAEEYELSCWIDGMTTETLNEFFTVLQNTSGLGSLLLFANAWQQVRPGTTVPSLPASPLLIQALQFLPRASEEFATLVGQIAFKSLLFIENPIALAIFLQQACQALREHESNASCSIVKKLGKYAKFLIGFSDRFVPLEDSELFSISVMLGLHSNDAQTPSPIPRRLCFVDALVLVRQLTHLIAVAGDSDLRVRMMETLRRLIPVVVSVSVSGFTPRLLW